VLPTPPLHPVTAMTCTGRGAVPRREPRLIEAGLFSVSDSGDATLVGGEAAGVGVRACPVLREPYPVEKLKK
ncbi:MAG: hypothetical protein P8077_04785, partial [Gammaproteobacteria bacterium]